MNNELQKLIEAYFSDELSAEQKTQAEKLLQEKCPQEFFDRREKETLIDQLFCEVDISAEAMQSIKHTAATKTEVFQQQLSSKKASPKVKKVRRKAQRKRSSKKSPIAKTFFITSSVAALLAIAFVFLFQSKQAQPIGQILVAGNELLINGKSSPQQQAIFANDVISGQGELKLNPGIIVNTEAQSRLKVGKDEQNPLSLQQGNISLQVASRRGKAPLYFHLPQGKVKVVGTEFTLHADKKSSSVSVSEGVVELEAHGKNLRISQGEQGYCSNNKIGKNHLFPQLLHSLSFDEKHANLKLATSAKILPGLFDQALHLDGKGGALFTSQKLSSNESFSFWVFIEKSGRSKNGQAILSHCKSSSGSIGIHLYEQSGQLHLAYKQKILETNIPDHSEAISQQQWQHVVFCRNSQGEHKLYLNGKMIFSDKKAIKPLGDKLYLGKSSRGFRSPLNGAIDELRIYGRMLKDEEVKKLYSEKAALFVK